MSGSIILSYKPSSNTFTITSAIIPIPSSITTPTTHPIDSPIAVSITETILP
ncbi:MAG: hypothetical protein UCV58_14715 [Clostridium saudiense]|nr:hypothetical protein [Clostridium saudiense]